MSSMSGITVSRELASVFADAVKGNTTRFIKVVIQNESLVHELSIQIQASFQEDLARLQDDVVLLPHSPAYVLAKLDLPSPDWMTFYYVPETAKVRDKMLYASTRSSLAKALGASLFSDAIFATSKADLTCDAYAAHLRHLAAPDPLSSREQELADLRVAENAAASYEGSHTRKTHLGPAPGYSWSPEAEEAIVEMGRKVEDSLVILTIDPKTESLSAQTPLEIDLATLGTPLPPVEPSYAVVSLHHPSTPDNLGRQVVFIYCCPPDSPVKLRMLYASGARTTHSAVKTILASSSVTLNTDLRKIETSDPSEITVDFLKSELNWVQDPIITSQPKGFVRKGPPRRRG